MIRLKIILYFAFIIWNFKECVTWIDEMEMNEAISEVKREAKTRPISNNVTLEGTRIGSGVFGFVLTAWFVDKKGRSKKVAAKFEKLTGDTKTIEREMAAFQLLGAHNPDCEYYGIPAVYCETTYLNFNVIVMTRLHKNVRELFYAYNFDAIDTLILMRDLMPIFKYFHSRSLLHRDVKPENVMVDEDGNVYIMDLNKAVRKSDLVATFVGAPRYMSILSHKYEPQIEAADISSIFFMYMEIGKLKPIAKVRPSPHIKDGLPWAGLDDDTMLLYKQDTDLVGELCNDMPGKLIPVCIRFYAEVIDSLEKKRLPNYDGLYELFDTYVKKNSGTTKTGQVRFSWLSPSARPQQNRPRIGDIKFRRNDTHCYDFSGPLPEKRANRYIVKPENRRTWPPTPPPQQPPMQPSIPALSRQSSNRAPPRKLSTPALERQPSNLALSRPSSMANRNRVDQDKNWERDSRERRERVPDARDDRIVSGMKHLKVIDERDDRVVDGVRYVNRNNQGSNNGHSKPPSGPRK